jgi:deazaflavin-dependent oxidoreductase (nitroreductase family)
MQPRPDAFKRIFKTFNVFMITMYRLGLGPLLGNPLSGYIMVIRHVGRKSERVYRTPVNFAVIDGDVYCMAGFGRSSDWFRNLMAHPQTEVWLPGGWWTGHAEEVSDPDVRLPIIRQVSINGGFAAPFFGGYNPALISDEELSQASEGVPLVRIRPERPCAGPGGPGGLMWVWLVVFILYVLWMLWQGR